MNIDIYKLLVMVNLGLQVNCPVLSGNMKSHIQVVDFKENEITIGIEAPFYDFAQWKKTGSIIPTRANIRGFTDYAYWVNKEGAFGTHNKSEHWVHRSLFNSVTAVSNQIGAEVVNELPL